MIMNDEELKEVLQALEEQGWNPMVCDTAVPVSSNPVVCGVPTDVGDVEMSDYVLLPKQLVGMYPNIVIPVTGNSMKDAGYEEGDSLRVKIGVAPHDGDDVLAWVDGGCTVKTLFTDEDGTRWLVPQNEDYDAIALTEGMDVRIFGVVTEVVKASCRPSSRSLLQSIRRTRNRKRAAKRLTNEEVEQILVRMGGEVLHARQWFSVYKAMVEYEVQERGDYSGFCGRVRALLPQHGHLPEAKEIARMDVQSFAKPIAMWDEKNAPVHGTRFLDYQRIAFCAIDCLSEKARKA